MQKVNPPKKDKKQPAVSFKAVHPQFFEVPQGKKTTFKGVLNDAVENRKQSLSQAIKYVKQNSQSHLKEFLKYKQQGLKRLVQSAAFEKTIHDLQKKSGLNREQAVLSLLYDDFLGDMWKRGKDAAATFWQKNKDSVFDMLKGAVVSILPKLLAIGGSKLKSQDPYAIDMQYIRSQFDELQLSCCPRQTLDPLAIMRNRTEIPITTGSGGIATVLINPFAACFGAGGAGVAGQNYYPFCSMSSSNTSLCYNGATITAGPFITQVPNMTGFLPDQCKASFISTQSALNAQGKITVGLYYDSPNVSLQMSAVNVFDGSTASLTSSEILNTNYSSRVYNVPECLMKVRHLARWIPTSNDFQSDLLNPAGGLGSRTNLTAAFIAIVFTGCTPSTTIGNLYLSTAISFKPTAQQIGVFNVAIRGSYQGTHRWFHQLRKNNVPVQFLQWNQIRQYVVQNYADLAIGSSDTGFCIDAALKQMGLQPFNRPWITVKQLQIRYPGLAHYVYGPTSKQGLIVDLVAKHAYVNNVVAKGEDQVYFGSTLYGRRFSTDFQSVYYQSPYQVCSFQTASAQVSGSILYDQVLCSMHSRLESIPKAVDSSFIINANSKPRMTYEGRQIKVDEKGIWIYVGSNVQGLYPNISYQMAAPYLQGNIFCPQELSRIQIQKQLLKSGVQPNPGPRVLTKTRESTSRQTPIQYVYQSLCADCCLRQAILIRASSKGSDLSDMKDRCDEHWQDLSIKSD